MCCITALRPCSQVSSVHVLFSRIKTLPVTLELVFRLTNCHLKPLPASTAASVELLDKALFQAAVGGGKCSVCSGSASACLVGSSRTAILLPPAGRLTGERNSKQVEGAFTWRATPPRYNPSKWNQSGTMHPTVASKWSPCLSLSGAHRGARLWRPFSSEIVCVSLTR